VASRRREKIGPERARELLATMGPPSYPVDPRQVQLYAERMKSGAWELQGECLILEEERMVSGRRRMLAVVEAGIDVDFVVIRGKAGEFDPLRGSSRPPFP